MRSATSSIEHASPATGVSAPYEPPADAEVVIDNGALTPEQAATEIIAYLRTTGHLGADSVAG